MRVCVQNRVELRVGPGEARRLRIVERREDLSAAVLARELVAPGGGPWECTSGTRLSLTVQVLEPKMELSVPASLPLLCSFVTSICIAVVCFSLDSRMQPVDVFLLTSRW